MIEAIRTVLFYVTPAKSVRLLQKAIGVKSSADGTSLEKLTDRELQVLQFLGLGMSTQAIATELDLSIKTIETYRDHLKAKLGLKDAAELIQYAATLVLGEPPPPANHPTRSAPPEIRL